MNYVPIAKGVEGLFIKNERFSTTRISINMYLPLKSEKVAVNALLPYILSSCSKDFPDFTALNLELANLYGADVGGVPDKVGDTQVLRFFSFSINDDLVPEDFSVVSEALELLLKMIFEPNVDRNGFKTCDLERERRLTVEKIEGLINEKRSYAIAKTLLEMYKDEDFGCFKCGSLEQVKAITEKSLYSALCEVLETATVRVNVIGKALPEGFFEKLQERFSKIDRHPVDILPAKPKKIPEKVTYIEDYMEVNQGKLVMGFVTDFTGNDLSTAHISVFADLLGGGPYSKLFKNVREKMSLCYYCAARVDRQKGFLLIDSGVEAEKMPKTEAEILNQLNDIKEGRFEDADLEASKKSIKDSLLGLNDSAAALDSWYSMRFGGRPISPEEFISAIEKVSREDVIEAAGLYTLDTVYRILPKERDGEK